MARGSRDAARSDAAKDQTASKGRRRGKRGAGRLVAMLAFLPIASRAPLYGRLLWELLIDERTPVARKALLGGALGYVILGRDLVPDEMPVIGGLDDLVVVALAVDLFLGGVEDALLNEKLGELGISRAAYDDDVARVRRIVPGPVRRVARRLPDAIGFVGEAFEHSGLAPRLRAWIT